MKRYKNTLELNRRTFLNTVSKAGLSMPFLKASTFATGMMLGRAAEAQTGTIKRVVCIYIPDGAPVLGTNDWLPTGSAGNLVLSPTTEPYAPYKDKCIFFSGATIVDAGGAEVGGHGNTVKAFGGQGYQNTYDVLLERTIGASSPFPARHFGVQTGSSHGYASKKDGVQVGYTDDPVAAFNNMFNSGVDASPIGAQRSKAILDVHAAELDVLKGVLGSAELDRLEEHLASVEKLKDNIDALSAESTIAGCIDPVFFDSSYSYNPSLYDERFTLEADLQCQNAVLALKCNLTNVVSIMFGNHQSEHIGTGLAFQNDYHQSIHGGNVSTYIETRQYLSQRMASLMEMLQSTLDEFGNPLLDSTLIIQSTDMGDGNAHSSTDAPVMMAGGSINGGQVVTCGSHTNVFDTATALMGLEGSISNLGNGPLTGITTS